MSRLIPLLVAAGALALGPARAPAAEAPKPPALPASPAPAAEGAPSPTPGPKLESIDVTLLGQPCKLEGPYPPAVLRKVHELSPDQLYPVEATAIQVDRSLGRIRAENLSRKAPAFLDRYRERLTQRLEALHAYFAALAAVRNSGKVEPLLKAARAHYLPGRKTGALASLAREYLKVRHGKSEPEKHAALEHLYTEYAAQVEPDPEEEFHRATQREQIQYDCSFDKSGKGVDDDDDDEDEEND